MIVIVIMIVSSLCDPKSRRRAASPGRVRLWLAGIGRPTVTQPFRSKIWQTSTRHIIQVAHDFRHFGRADRDGLSESKKFEMWAGGSAVQRIWKCSVCPLIRNICSSIFRCRRIVTCPTGTIRQFVGASGKFTKLWGEVGH